MNVSFFRTRVKRTTLSQAVPEHRLRLRPVDPNEELSRREFFKRIKPPTLAALIKDVSAKRGLPQKEVVTKDNAPFGIVEVDPSRCTGCSLCALDCPTEALNFVQEGDDDSYRMLFQRERCTGCGLCQKSCPEHCLTMAQGIHLDKMDHGPTILFEDRVTRCKDCGTPLFPQAMIRCLRSKMSAAGNAPWAIDLCPVCRLKGPLAGGRTENI